MSGIPYPNTQAIFYEQYESARRDEVVGILLALFLGTFGVHHFYLRRTGLGILYCFFCWTGITTVLGFIECFFMPGRVREFNAIQAAGIAAALGMSVPQGWGYPINVTVNVPPAGTWQPQGPGQAQWSGQGPGQAPGQDQRPAPASTLPLAGTLLACAQCHQTNVVGSRFCSACGATL